jgi:hypothetical protein
VRRLGCNSVQGYFLGRPQAPEDLPAAILEAQRRREPTVDAPRRLKQRTG